VPYRLNGKTVLKRTPSGDWAPLKRHDSVEHAREHLRALYANVKDVVAIRKGREG